MTSNFSESIHNQPKMYLHHLGLNHIIMRNIQTSCKLQRSDMINNPNKHLFHNPLKIFGIGFIIILTGKPFELQTISPSPSIVKLLVFCACS